MNKQEMKKKIKRFIKKNPWRATTLAIVVVGGTLVWRHNNRNIHFTVSSREFDGMLQGYVRTFDVQGVEFLLGTARSFAEVAKEFNDGSA